MLKFIKKIVNKAEVKLTDKNKKERFYSSLDQLVSILFAVVFGVALSQLKEVIFLSNEFFVLCLAYVAVILSWWGYHWGIVVGPRETNILNYIIDCSLLVVYWLLMNKRAPFSKVLLWYTIMFLLYLVWELIRSCKEDRPLTDKTRIKNAIWVNSLSFFLFFILYFTYSSSKCILFFYPFYVWGNESYYVLGLFILLIGYRIWIHRIYPSQEKSSHVDQMQMNFLDRALIQAAKEATSRARTHLSGFAVGAAIMSDTGKTFVGSNIEFDNYSNTIHAEESAISAFVTAGERKPVSIAIFTFSDTVAFPCGMCRQSLFELGGEELRVIACNSKTCEIKTMRELLPMGFHL